MWFPNFHPLLCAYIRTSSALQWLALDLIDFRLILFILNQSFTISVSLFVILTFTAEEEEYFSLGSESNFFFNSFQSTVLTLIILVGTLKDAGASWMGFNILILIYIWLLTFVRKLFFILALCIEFKGTKTWWP